MKSYQKNIHTYIHTCIHAYIQIANAVGDMGMKDLFAVGMFFIGLRTFKASYNKNDLSKFSSNLTPISTYGISMWQKRWKAHIINKRIL
jgi:hypothetical protein